MSQKDRERQKRRQKRGLRHKQKRAGAPHRAQPDAAELRHQAIGFMIDACGSLLTGEGRLDEEAREHIQRAGAFLPDLWAKLVFELEGFLYQDRPWGLGCAEIEPLCGHFRDAGAGSLFGRIWALSRSNEPELPGRLPDSGPDGAPLGHGTLLAFAFWRLYACLDAPTTQDHAAALKAIRDRVGQYTDAKAKRALDDVLKSALSSLLPPGRGRKPAVPRELAFVRDAEAFVRAHRPEHGAPWWDLARLFLREVLRRHGRARGTAWLADHPDLIEALFGAPAAALIRAPAEAGLQAIHADRQCEEWLAFLEHAIDREALGFEGRVRYEIARIKLLRARAQQLPAEISTGERQDLMEAFEGLIGLLGRGVPPEARHLPPVLEPALIDHYAETCRRLAIFKCSKRLSQSLLRRHPDDHRLLCLYVTGALLHRDKAIEVPEAAGQRLWSHVEPELFAHCSDYWRSVSGEDRARQRLYASLAREQKTRCLLALARRRLRAAATADTCRAAIEGLADYLDTDGFVYEALRQGAALERDLVFIGTLSAAWRGISVPTLPYAAFIQFLGHAATLGAELPAAEGMVAEFLQRHPERWFARADGWQRLEALSEAISDRLFRSLRQTVSRLLGPLPRPAEEGAGHQRLLRRLGLTLPRRAKHPSAGKTKKPAKKKSGPQKPIQQGELF
jgi:hypothetical protein